MALAGGVIWLIGLATINLLFFLFVLAPKDFRTVFGIPIFGHPLSRFALGLAALVVNFIVRKVALQALVSISIAFLVVGSRAFYSSSTYERLFGDTQQSILTAALILVLSVAIAIIQSEMATVRTESFATFERISERYDRLAQLIEKLPPAALKGIQIEKIPLDLAESRPHTVIDYDGHSALDEIAKVIANISSAGLRGFDVANFMLCAAQIEHYYNVRSSNLIRNAVYPSYWINFCLGLTILIVAQFCALVLALGGNAYGVLIGDLVSLIVVSQVLFSLMEVLSRLAQESRELEPTIEFDHEPEET